MADNVISKPSLIGTMRISSQYQLLSTGLTDSVLLIGHADAEVMYEPYRVVNMQAAVNFLGADQTSPLLRAMLEIYNADGKDIWLYPAAPMSEYVEPSLDRTEDLFYSGVVTGLDPSLPRNTIKYLNITTGAYTDSNQGMYNFHEKWYERLTHAYARLIEWDFPDIVTPLEASHYNTTGVDFTTQLVNYCDKAFSETGSMVLGVIGARLSNITQSDIDTLISDTRLSSYGEAGKYVIVVLGEGIIKHSQMATTYAAPLSTQVAGLMATTSYGRSIAGVLLPSTSSLVGNDLTETQIDQLTQAKLNPVIRTKRGKRGLVYQSRLVTDNTLGEDDSDFWALTQMRILANVVNKIRELGYAFIGEIKFDLFKQAVVDYLNALKTNKFIWGYNVKIDKQNNGQTAAITLAIMPVTGIRNIYFTTEVGPGI